MRIIAIALVSAGILTSCGGDKSNKKDGKKDGDTVIKTEVSSANVGDLTIAYYEMEKLTTGFDFYRTVSAEMEKEGLAIQQELEGWQRSYESAARKMTDGMQNGTLSTDQIEGLDRKVKQAEKSIMNIQQNKAVAYQQKQMEMNSVLEQKLVKYSEEYAKANGIKMLYAKGAGTGIAYIDSSFDVTEAFIQYINAKEKELNAEIAE